MKKSKSLRPPDIKQIRDKKMIYPRVEGELYEHKDYFTFMLTLMKEDNGWQCTANGHKIFEGEPDLRVACERAYSYAETTYNRNITKSKLEKETLRKNYQNRQEQKDD